MKTEKELAIELFNQTWDLMDKPERSPEEDFLMLHKAHASCYHWSQCGTTLELARGEWQISRVNVLLKQGEAALSHAQRSLQLCLDNGYGDFDLAFGYEACACAFSLLKDPEKASRCQKMGIDACGMISDPDDKAYALSALNGIS